MDEAAAGTSGTPRSGPELDQIYGTPSSSTGFRWTDELVGQLIQWRGENDLLFTRRRNTAIQGFEAFVSSHGLHGKITAALVRKKWENLKQKYKLLSNLQDLKTPKTRVRTEHGEKTAGSWKWFGLMDSLLGGKPFFTQPIFITSDGQESVHPSTPSADFLPISDDEDVAAAPPTLTRKRKREEDQAVAFLQDMQKREEEARVKEEERYEEARLREEVRCEEARRREESRDEEARRRDEMRDEEARRREESRDEEARKREEKRDEEARRREESRDEEARKREEKRDEEERRRVQRQEERDERFMLLLAALAKK